MFWFACGLCAFMIVDAITDWIRAKAAELEAETEKIKFEIKQKQSEVNNNE